jgi:hypothetical protein
MWVTPLPSKTEAKHLGLIITDDCSWENRLKPLRTKVWLHSTHGSMSSRTTSTLQQSSMYHRHVHQTMHHVRHGSVGSDCCNGAIKMLAQLESRYGWPSGQRWHILGHLRRLYATDLLHMDAGIRSLRSDNEAAHLRLFHKVFNSSDTSIQHRVFKSLPDHPWLQRVYSARSALTEHTETILSQPCTYAMSMEITNQKRLQRSMIP